MSLRLDAAFVTQPRRPAMNNPTNHDNPWMRDPSPLGEVVPFNPSAEADQYAREAADHAEAVRDGMRVGNVLDPVRTLRPAFTEPAMEDGGAYTSIDGPAIFPVWSGELWSPVTDGREMAAKSPFHKAICRDNAKGNPVMIGIVGQDFSLVEHARLYGEVEARLIDAAGPRAMDRVEVRDSVSGNGAWARRDYVFPEVHADLAQRSDVSSYRTTRLDFRASVTNAYDGTSRAILSFGSIDAFCDNGLVYMHNRAGFFRKHTSGFSMPDFSATFTAGVDQFREQAEVMQRWARMEITGTQAREALKALPGISARRTKQLAARFEEEAAVRGPTVWAMVSAMTNYSSHSVGDFKVRETGRDSVAQTLAAREEEVAVWIASPAFRNLAAVAA
jgi:hypothetical protein